MPSPFRSSAAARLVLSAELTPSVSSAWMMGEKTAAGWPCLSIVPPICRGWLISCCCSSCPVHAPLAVAAAATVQLEAALVHIAAGPLTEPNGQLQCHCCARKDDPALQEAAVLSHQVPQNVLFGPEHS